MTPQPAIFVHFYFRYVKNGIPCTRIGGGCLDDVLDLVDQVGICVLSTLEPLAGDLTVKIGRALVDDVSGGITQLPVPDLDYNGAPIWLFWNGANITGAAARHIERELDASRGSLVRWVRVDSGKVTGVDTDDEARLGLEAAWANVIPNGPVYVRFQGERSDLGIW